MGSFEIETSLVKILSTNINISVFLDTSHFSIFYFTQNSEAPLNQES